MLALFVEFRFADSVFIVVHFPAKIPESFRPEQPKTLRYDRQYQGKSSIFYATERTMWIDILKELFLFVFSSILRSLYHR